MTDTCPLAKYKNLFGEPGSRTGMRKYRIFNVSIFDVVVVLVFAYIFSLLNGYSFALNALVLFILGIIVHRLFCVRTTVDKILFP